MTKLEKLTAGRIGTRIQRRILSVKFQKDMEKLIGPLLDEMPWAVQNEFSFSRDWYGGVKIRVRFGARWNIQTILPMFRHKAHKLMFCGRFAEGD